MDETLDDIIAEMRGNEFDDPHLDASGIIGTRKIAREWADRIEAAAKRDEDSRGDAKARRVGNMAKLREALEIAKKAICHHARASHICDSLAWENSTINANCGDILCAHRDLCEAKTARSYGTQTSLSQNEGETRRKQAV